MRARAAGGHSVRATSQGPHLVLHVVVGGCRHPESCPKLYSLKRDPIEVRGTVKTSRFKDRVTGAWRTYTELVVVSVRPVGFSGKRGVPAYDFVDGETVPYERGPGITARCGRLDPAPLRHSHA